MIEIIATAESLEQANALLDVEIDTLYIGNDEFGIRLPTSFTKEEMKEITEVAHAKGKKVCIAVNALMHNEQIEKITPYLHFLREINVDSITVGDPGVIHVLKKEAIDLSYVYDAQTLVTSARQVNFWKERGAIGAVLARELTFIELEQIAKQVDIPMEVLVYGATCIHHSKRPLLKNYFHFTQHNENDAKERGLFLSEPKKLETHYSIYEDAHGTHIFATDDINLMEHLYELAMAGLVQWKLDGIFTKGDAFVRIAKLFVEAKQAIIAGQWTGELASRLNEQVLQLHPVERTVNEGFFLMNPSEVQ
ncbi:peptidase U32 family protein [Paenibacillus yanchengensis]|uniref:Peptidase U32 family protein n=1 Tax=Paenibacillus yanchengensis TaxID=2035833 RepID=A0ABW4YEZ9_9BACL